MKYYECPQCKGPVQGGSKFCSRCGFSLPYTPPAGLVELAHVVKWLIYGVFGLFLIVVVLAVIFAVTTPGN